jgi:MFS transporter, PAT family, beta-lactamase induction signal transducer AmpG
MKEYQNNQFLKKSILLTLLYLVQGLPFGFFMFTFPLHLRSLNYSLTKITFISVVNFPWLIKFLWAPLVDKYYIKKFGRRKSWIIPAQAALVISLLVTGFLSEKLTLFGLMVFLSIVNFFAATQDIAVDGLAIDILNKNERGVGNSIQAGAYKIGMLGGGFGLTFLLPPFGIEGCFYAMGILVMLAMIPIVFLNEKNLISEKTELKKSESKNILPVILNYFKTKGAFIFLAFIVFVKAGDALANPLFRLILKDLKMSIGKINWIMNMGGITATLLGSAVCGFIIMKFGRIKTLWFSIITQGISHLLWAILPFIGNKMFYIFPLAIFEHFVSGMLTVIVFTLMMDSVSKKVGSSQYTILMSLYLGVSFILGIASGYFADLSGYEFPFLAGGILTLLTLLFISPLKNLGFLDGSPGK